jgi:hypothetical protein
LKLFLILKIDWNNRHFILAVLVGGVAGGRDVVSGAWLLSIAISLRAYLVNELTSAL